LLQYVAMCCSVLQCVAVCCSVLQCVAVYMDEHSLREVWPRVPAPCVAVLLQYVAVCCRCVAVIMDEHSLCVVWPRIPAQCVAVLLQYVAVSCSVLQFIWMSIVSVWFGSENLHSVLQCIAACCNVLHCVAVNIDDHDFQEVCP